MPNINDMLRKIEIKIIHYEELYLEFDIKNAPISFLNAIRRILINEIPTIAIDKVIIYENSGVMSDESLCHRIGLVPIIIDKDEYMNIDENVDLSGFKFYLNVENKRKDICEVMSDDLKISGNNIFIKDIVPGILITKLAPGQEIRLEAIVKVGTGKMHTKWSPVCPASYKFMPYIKKEGDGINNEQRTDMRNCKLSEFDGNKVFRDENHVIFTIKSLVIDPFLLLKKSFAILKEKGNILDKDIEKVLGNL
ncbi:DNA-directed RNA polymerase II subunit rpb3 [Dictyocoela muelleri]|nr:DNA-directed RNA polymerase II subunit rpb3 [Dictyocoela muelleri]